MEDILSKGRNSMIQAPNLLNPYMQPQMQPYVPQYTQTAVPAPNYNAVKIDVHNPSVSAPGVGQVAMNAPQYAQPTMPYYTYPQAQLYSYPQAQNQPYYLPPQQAVVCQPLPEPMPGLQPQTPAQQIAESTMQPAPQQVIQQNYNTPAPMITQPVQIPAEQQAPQTPKVEIEQPVPMTPQVDLNSFIAKLANPDFEVQANAMEEIANMVKDDPQKATELFDEKVINALNTIINADSSKLAGPTQDQIAVRQKLMKGEQLSDADKKLATTITPMEQCERNKSYAMFTSSIMQKLYGDEVAKLTGSNVPLTELPGAVAIVEQLKNNPNPMVRTSAIEALSYIQHPAYKQDLTTLFTIAKNDHDKNVQDAAQTALTKLEQMPAEQGSQNTTKPQYELKPQQQKVAQAA